MQATNDTEKRNQTHLEGKVHTGFALLRKELEQLKKRKEILRILSTTHRAERREEIKKKETTDHHHHHSDKVEERRRSRDREARPERDEKKWSSRGDERRERHDKE